LTTELQQLARQLRRDVVELTRHSGTGSSHLGGELSLAEIIAVLYSGFLRLDPSLPSWQGRDRIVLSKGHASAIMYAAMAWRGFFPRERLFDQFNRVGGFLQEHVNMECPGAEVPTGSLGMGLSAGAGMAWGVRRVAENAGTAPIVYVILSDGDCQEGQTWEAAMAAAKYRLDNLVAVVDYNRLIVVGSVEQSVNLEPFRAKWEAFGWHAVEIDGHDIQAIVETLDATSSSSTAPGKPRVIIAHTLKGKGVSFMEGDNAWHSGHPTEEQCMRALRELAC
jgi:transketolase